MKIAVTYKNGEVFEHFGRTECFKVYTVEDGVIEGSEFIESEGSGHGALAGVLAQKGVDVVICGGLGDGAFSALTEAGIEVIAGAKGNADETVDKYLRGELENSGVNCDHHGEGHSEENEEDCDCGCGGGCGGCGGGCGGCGGPAVPDFDGPNVGKTVKVHYRGTFDDGTQFDSSYDRGQTLDFVCGAGMMIKGFDRAVAIMSVGETLNIHLMPEDAYGPKDPNAYYTVAISEMPGAEEVNVGEQVYLYNAWGQPVPVIVSEKDEVNITFDTNHEMAGKELNFEITLVEVVE